MKEEQQFELLEKLRKMAHVGIMFLKGALNSTNEGYVKIDSIEIKRNELEQLKKTLENVKNAQALEETKMELKDVYIPRELTSINRFWGELKILISKI